MPEQQLLLSPRHGWPTSTQPYWLMTSGLDFFLPFRFFFLFLASATPHIVRVPRPSPVPAMPRTTSRRDGEVVNIWVASERWD